MGLEKFPKRTYADEKNLKRNASLNKSPSA
jgi:hypothetical protein